MSDSNNPISVLNATGTPYDVGVAIGNQGRSAVHEKLLPSALWVQINDKKHRATVDRLSRNTEREHPRIWEEIQGLAEGLQLPLEQVMAWNCRGDILASVPDGCTTVMEPGAVIRIAHNEDGLPFFRGHCFLLNAVVENDTPFSAFCYPGSIPGHTFGWNKAGLAQSVNNLRLHGVNPKIPRMVLSRAVIGSPTLKDALDILSASTFCGGFHMCLADASTRQLLSIEYGAGALSIKAINERCGHTNHTLHLTGVDQTITASSHDRQERLEQLLASPQYMQSLEILRDNSGRGLPIRRDDPEDPDDENTLATGLLSISQDRISWELFNSEKGAPVIVGSQLPESKR